MTANPRFCGNGATYLGRRVIHFFIIIYKYHSSIPNRPTTIKIATILKKKGVSSASSFGVGLTDCWPIFNFYNNKINFAEKIFFFCREIEVENCYRQTPINTRFYNQTKSESENSFAITPFQNSMVSNTFKWFCTQVSSALI